MKKSQQEMIEKRRGKEKKNERQVSYIFLASNHGHFHKQHFNSYDE
jgi:hypothetical protein